MYTLRFRQVHLDFHTSPAIDGIGDAFDKAQWQDALKRGHVDSITTFAVGHHGWHYYETEVGAMHPGLKFDLLRAQYDAAREIDVNVPIYITAGVNNRAAHEHPEWREVGADGRYNGWARNITDPGFHKLCFNTPYTDYLCDIIREVAEAYPDCNGIFLDIISQGQCCCKWCLDLMEKNGLDALNEQDRQSCAEMGLKRYFEMTTAACREKRADMPVFHNSGHIYKGDRERMAYNSHLELESLPTGGWGYDHFPLSAKYCLKTDFDVMGMTGKFHTTWGEFGGYKHPNALRYECAAMLAYGSKCSVGDQLHPSGEMDDSTYDIIGAAYAEVEAKEAWCRNVQNVADVALLSAEAAGGHSKRDCASDIGAGRLLLEGHMLFDVIDADMDFSSYAAILIPDEAVIDAAIKAKLDAFVANGGKLILAGGSAFRDGEALFDIGADSEGQSPFQPDYAVPVEHARPDFCESPMVMYMPSQRIRVTDGESLGAVHDPYFNRDFRHFCSHQHTPPKPEPSGYDCGSIKGNVLYFAHPVFSLYRATGAVALKQYVLNALGAFLDGDLGLSVSLPSTGRASVMDQPDEKRRIVHLLYANTITRGGPMSLSGGTLCRDSSALEVIEELLPLSDIDVRVRCEHSVSAATLEPEGEPLPFEQDGDWVSFRVPEVERHQMVALQF